MIGRHSPPLVVVVVASLACAAGGAALAVDFAHEVVPLLKRHCGECHAGDARQGGFSMNTREALLAGGDSGVPGLVPGRADGSELVLRITATDPDIRMPSEGDPLPAEAVATLRRWIDEGAAWEPGFAFERSSWEPPLSLRAVTLPPAVDGRTNPVDRIVDAWQSERGIPRPARCDDRTFVRRVSLDLTGLLPEPARVERFVADAQPDKRQRLVRELLGDDAKLAYAEHWLSFWNDLLRNDYTGTGTITGGRRQVTTWLHRALVDNKPYDRLVRELVAPTDASRGFIDGIVWRGTVNASQTVPIQFAQNVGQTFLGINLKCASCHDSFVDRWTLAQTYALAAIAAPTPLELHRCEKATGVMAAPAWPFPELGQVDAAAAPAQRLEQLAALLTRPENGWLSRTLVNRLWHRLMGRGIVHPVDSLRTPPWSEDLLEMLAGDLVAHGWDVKHVLETIATSEAYGVATPPVAWGAEAGSVSFAGPLPRRMTAEQFTDAVWQLTHAAPARPDAEVLRFDPPARADAARPVAAWIWSNDQGDSPPGERLAFRRTLTLPAAATHAVVVLAADNEATLFVNGKRAARADDWRQPVRELLTADLREGKNDLLATAANAAAGGPAALLAEVRVACVDGSTATLATDAAWEWTASRPDANGAFPKAAKPTWAPAAVVATQATWQAAAPRFAEQLAHGLAPERLPMVRASLVKATPLMAALGRPNRDQVVTSRPADLTTLEAIRLANEQSFADELGRGGEAILERCGPAADSIVDHVFRTALARPAEPAEAAAGRDLLGAEPTPQGVADLLWAVVMLPEFQLVR